MTAKTIVALYDDIDTARYVIQELVDSGFTNDQISLVANDAGEEYSRYFDDDASRNFDEEVDSGAGVGAGIGAIIGGLGGLVVGLGALAIPGIGPVVAAGPLATAVSALAGAGIGAVAGGVTGGLLGALVDMGVPEEQAGYYTEGVRRGGTLLVLQADEMMHDRAVEIMNRYNPVDIRDRANYWQEQGWTGFDTDEHPYTTEEIERERTYFGGSRDYDYDSYDHSFRHHYMTNLADAGYPYDYFEPAYHYGYDLAYNEDYRDRDWDDFELSAREEWERDHPGTWEEFKASIRHAWEEVKDAFS
jgi:hypothetical protein